MNARSLNLPQGRDSRKNPDNRGFSLHAKNGEKKNLLSLTHYNFRTRLGPNLFSSLFDKAGTVLVSS